MPIEPATVEFIGGPHDGHIARTDDDDPWAATLARAACLFTDYGRKQGVGMPATSPAAYEALRPDQQDAFDRGFGLTHKYFVTHRSLQSDRVILRMEFASGTPAS